MTQADLKRTQTKQAKHTALLGKWRVTKAIDDDGFYIRCTSEDGTDTPVAITRHGNQKDNAHYIVNALNSHEELLGALQAVVTFYSKSTNGKSHLLSDDEAGLVSRCKAALTHATGE